MKLNYVTLSKPETESFYVSRRTEAYKGDNWHYHDEFEILLSIKGGGVMIVGDKITNYNAGELMLLGSSLPHLFKNTGIDADEDEVDFIVVKFSSQFLNQSLFDTPEFSRIKNFIKKANRGLIFSKQFSSEIKPFLVDLTECKGADRMILLFKILNKLSKENDLKNIASKNYSSINFKEEDRLQNVIDYISKNYFKDISLQDLSDLSHMTTNSFCRFFKNKTGKTAFEFIREYRINKACQMLMNGRKSISQICYETGFSSFSSFNRVFKQLKKVSAKEYKKKYFDLKQNFELV